MTGLRRRWTKRLSGVVGLVLSCAVALPSAHSYAAPPPGGRSDKRARAVRIANPPRIDGVLDDEAWRSAVPISDFVQSQPIEGADPTQRTVVRIVYDDDAVYIGAMLYDSDPARIVARLSRRDDQVQSDGFSIRFDTFHDHQTAYEFTVSAAGTKIDILQYDDGEREDESWDAVWDAETIIGPEGWSAELRIPFSMLRFLARTEQEWGLQIIRWITRSQETQQWALIRRAESGWVSRFGHLDGIAGIPSSAGVEVLPYTVVESSRLNGRTGRAPVRSMSTDLGVDLKYRPTANLTIDATINPDFGQVEADPAVLNLSTFETFYPERRPFFVEGVQIFRFATFGGGFGPGMFYSRRIGRPLSPSVPDGGYVERDPGFASIIGAVKVSGKSAGGLSYGVLEAVTKDEYADVVDSAGVRSRQLIDPVTNFSLVRLRQDFGGNSNAGLILTNVARRDRIPAITGGFDWSVKLDENMYLVDGFLALSRTARTGDLLEGSAGKLEFSKTGGEHWRGRLSTDFTSRKYDINDIGFFRRPGDYGYQAEVSYRDDMVGRHARRWFVGTSFHRRMNIDDVLLFQRYEVEGFVQFLNYWEAYGRVDLGTAAFDDRETRGLGLFRKAPTQSYYISIETDPRSSIVFDFSYGRRTDSRGASGHEFGLECELRPTTALTLEFEVEIERLNDQFAWAANVTDPAFGPAKFSVFADRSTRAWDLRSRGTYVFTRDITLQWYVQLFIAKGFYRNEQRRLGVDAYAPYTFNAPDFTSQSVHSNLVLRWEYVPGSTLYLVWSHAREGGLDRYVDPISTNLRDAFRTLPDNVFLLKLSYWLSS